MNENSISINRNIMECKESNEQSRRPGCETVLIETLWNVKKTTMQRSRH